MKKIVRMSLVAAVAVAGLTTVNAKPLEEAIKNVDVSGSVGYRYDDFSDENSGSSTTNKYKIGLSLSSKVNDDVKVNTRFIVGGANNGYANLNAQDGSDVQPGVVLSNVYFGYTGIKNTTVNVGKQGIPTPWTVAQATGGSDASEQTGTGILALSTLGPVTVAAAYFNQTNIGGANGAGNVGDIGKNDIATVGIIANAGPVALDVWAIQIADIADSFTFGAKTSFDAGSAKLGAGLRYTSLEVDGDDTTDSLLKVMLTAKVGIFNAGYTFGVTDEEGGFTAVDNDAATTINGWAITMNGKADATWHNLSLGLQVMPSLNLSVSHTMLESTGATIINIPLPTAEVEESESILKAVYKMSKNLTTIVMLGQNETEIESITFKDETRGRLEVVYTF